MLRWSLILIFMFLKAGFIVAIFMHVAWERRALKIVILGPPIALMIVVARRVKSGFYERTRGNYEMVEIAGLYWHFVDLVWVFIFAFFYLW